MVVSLVSIHGDVWRFSAASICSVVSRLENSLPAVDAVGLFGVLDQDRFFTRWTGSQQLGPAEGAEFGLVDRFAADLMPFDAEPVGDAHPGLVSLQCKFFTVVARAVRPQGELCSLECGRMFGARHELFRLDAETTSDAGDHRGGWVVDPPGLQVGEVGLLDTEEDEIPLCEPLGIPQQPDPLAEVRFFFPGRSRRHHMFPPNRDNHCR